jgi:hypothetical protein
VSEYGPLLFMDDSPDRAATFLANFPEARWVQTAAECIDALKSQRWDMVFLDHDLGGESMVSPEREDCGMEVVRYMMAHPVNVRSVIVHSWNTPAAKRMVDDLRRRNYNARYSPFGEDNWSKPK